MQQLKSGSLLQGGKYKIEKVLGQGGFGITYLAIQELLNRKVAIKEFFYKDYCERDEATSHVTLGTNSNRELVERFMEKFIKEARTISTLNHPHIIRIYDIFKENNTAYYVMEYIEGESLAEMVKRQGALSEDVAVGYIKQVASALEFVHQHSINHLDVKPANVMVRREDNQTVLIDFGLSKQYDASGEQTSTTPVGISHGYAPMEQYNVGGVSTFSPQTDIYSLGATLYKLVIGNSPPQAIEIFNDGLPELPSFVSLSVNYVIKKAMQPRKVERYNNIKEFVGALNPKSGLDEETVFIQQTTDEKQPKPTFTNGNKKSKSSHNIIVICIIALLVGLGALVIPKNNQEVVPSNNTKAAKEIYDEAMTYYSSKEYLKAIPLFEQAANMGDADAQVQLGYCYYAGNGVSTDYKLALKWTQKAANQWSLPAFYYMGIYFSEGTGVKKDIREAIYWWDKAANEGYAPAQYKLGICYYYGNGIEKNLEKAKKWLKKSAEQGYKGDVFISFEEIEEHNQTVVSNGKISGYECADLGLSVKWATCNVGASTPSDYGNYYAWGEMSTKSTYLEDNQKAVLSTNISNDIDYDVATSYWGRPWRIPTKNEMEELVTKCKWIEDNLNGHNGYKIIGPNGNSIFLPASGMRTGSSIGLDKAGYYWTSNIVNNEVYHLAFNCSVDYYHLTSTKFKYFGLNIRPVAE